MRPSNGDRRRWRDQCRQRLAEHLESKLGLAMEPAQVRLQPRAEEPYTWQALPEKQALFSKNLSDHSIGAYKELWAGVGETFEAVPKHLVADPTNQSFMTTSLRESKLSFSEIIDGLQQEKAGLAQEVSRCRDEAIAERSKKQELEAKVGRLEEIVQRLEKQVQQNSATTEFCNPRLRMIAGMSQELSVAMQQQSPEG